MVYLLKMHGASIAWFLPVFVAYLGCFVIGQILLGLVDEDGSPLHVAFAGGWQIATFTLGLSLFIVMAGAMATGERWVRRHRATIAPNETVSWQLPQGNRGIWSPLWLTEDGPS